MVERLKNSKQREIIREIKKSFLNGLTKEQINTYIDNNVIDLNSAKQFLKKLSIIILYLLKGNNLQ